MKKRTIILILLTIWLSCSKDKAIYPIVEFEISGQVLNAKDSTPLANISVELGTTCNKTYGDEMTEKIVTTDNNGKYHIKHKGASTCTYFLYFNSYPASNPNFYNDWFYFKPNESLIKNTRLHPFTTLTIKAINLTPSDTSRKVYISTIGANCFSIGASWCDSITTNRARGHGYTIIEWFTNSQTTVNYDSVFTYSDSVNTYTLNY